MGQYLEHLKIAKKKLQTFREARFMDLYGSLLTFYEKADMKLELAVRLFNEVHKTTDEELDLLVEKLKNEMLLELKHQDKMREFVVFYQMYLDIEHSKMAEDGNTKEARSVIKDWLASTPGMKELLEPKKDGPLVKINSDNKTTNNVLSFNPRLRLSDLPSKWQELAQEMKDKKLLERKTVEITEFEGIKSE